MRYYFCALVLIPLAGMLCAQQQQNTQYTSYGYDINGRRVRTGSVSDTRLDSSHSWSEQTQSLNGRTAPQEQVQEKVLSEGPDGRVVERIVQRYGQDAMRKLLSYGTLVDDVFDHASRRSLQS